MEEKVFKDAAKFFNWVTEVAKSGGINIKTLGTHDGEYWVKYEPVINLHVASTSTECKVCHHKDINEIVSCSITHCPKKP